MKRLSRYLLLLLVLLMFSGCSNGENEEQEEKGFYLYYINNTESKIVKESYKLTKKEQQEQIEEVLVALHNTPSDLANKKTIPDNVNLPTYVFSPEGQLQLRFDATYQELNGISEILRRAAIVKTLCQIQGVEQVEFYVADVPLMDPDGKAVGSMDSSSFIESSDYVQQQQIVLYFSNLKRDNLVSINALANYDGSTPIERIVINQLIEGPSTIDRLGQEVINTIPKGTKCLNISTSDYICYVDLNDAFLDRVDGVQDEIIIYSIVNSLASLPSINKVKFTIEGEAVKKYGTVENFDQFFEKNYKYNNE